MNPARREHVRLSCIRYIAASSRFGLETNTVLQFIRQEGLRELSREDVETELDYLAGKGLIEAAPKLLSPENKLWKATPAGRDYVAEQKLEQE